MSHLTSSKPSYEDSNNLTRGIQVRRSLSLDSWILDDTQELCVEVPQNPDDDSDIDFSLINRPKSLEDSWITSNALASLPDNYYLPDNCEDVFFSEESPTFDRTTKNGIEKTGRHHEEFEVTECDRSLRWEPIENSLSHHKKITTQSEKITKASNSPNNHESNSSFLGQLFSNKKKPVTLHRTRSTGSVHDNSNSSPSNKTAGSSFFKYNKQSRNSNEQSAQVKTKIRSIWNNMKYGWRVRREVNLKVDTAIWLLGECYHNKAHDGTLLSHDVANLLKHDLLSKITFTYRINFPAIPGTDIVSDSGWGCMLRAGQMMMAQALVSHFLHRDWRVSVEQPVAKKKLHRMILRWFGDTMSKESPFSIHHLVSFGEQYGRKAGDWYGPTHVAHVLRDALKTAKTYHPKLKDMCMYVASDGIVFKQDVFDLCSESASCVSSTNEEKFISNASESHSSSHFAASLSQPSSSEKWSDNPYTTSYTENNSVIENTIPRTRHVSECEEVGNTEMSFMDPCPSYNEYGPPSFSTVENDWESLILFVSVRLGNDKINPFYIPCLKSLLAYENCIGIIGGRPKHALYFIGWQEEKLIHMDPHSCQPAIDVEREDFSIKSFHSSSVRTMQFSEMDPSCAIGFYFRRKEDFEVFIDKFDEITAPMKKNLDYPVFALADGKRAEIENMSAGLNPKSHSFTQSLSNDVHNEDDDYILL